MDNMTLDQQQILNEKQVTNVDFRMVTFTLAGRDYAIDIMKVKEISKDNKFTYVPNASPFVIGVYNLRGDIISVIDLRIFFNQKTRSFGNETTEALENMIILRLEDHTIAVIVDTIEMVVGIPSEAIQPPHPLFGDINVKYISGIVESQDKLYVILDVEKIFNSEESETLESSPVSEKVAASTIENSGNSQNTDSEDELNINFISESLATFKNMYVSSVNIDWVKNRYKNWKKIRLSERKNIQFENEGDSYKFLEGFNSPYTGNFWDNDFAEKFKKILPSNMGSTYYVLNAGCGNGSEAYSLASIIKSAIPGVLLKILAYDNDLMGISSAPTLNVDKEFVPDFYWENLVETVSGNWQFNDAIKDSIIFEYHDVTHNANLPALDMVVIRDLLSVLTAELQIHVLSMIMDNLKPGGILIIGKNEKIDIDMGFEERIVEGITIYIKK